MQQPGRNIVVLATASSSCFIPLVVVTPLDKTTSRIRFVPAVKLTAPRLERDPCVRSLAECLI
jgi:hypothetical protein